MEEHMYIFLLIGLLCSTLFGADVQKKPKILILTSAGGRGHTSAAEALHEYLGTQYDVKDVNLLNDILGSLDVVKKASEAFGIKNFGYEDLYNKLLVGSETTKEFIGPLNAIGSLYLSEQNEKVFKLIETYLRAEKPDLIISVVPLYNNMALQVAQQLKIPLWIIPVDFDATKFVENMGPVKPYECFINISITDPLVVRTLAKGLERDCIPTYVGMPVRKQFLKKYDRSLIKRWLNISNDKTVIMVMLGGRGSNEMIDVAEQLAQVKGNVHFLFCIGSADIKQSLRDIIRKNGMSAHVIGFTKKIAQFMAISDLLITKSGGQTVAEALYMQLPMLLDVRSKALSWEELNRTLVLERQLGADVRNIKQYAPMVQQIVDDPRQLKRWKANFQKMNLKNPVQEVPANVRFILQRRSDIQH